MFKALPKRWSNVTTGARRRRWKLLASLHKARPDIFAMVDSYVNVFNNMMEGISQHSLTKANVLSEHDAEARPVYRTTAADHDKLESEASASRDARDDANNDAKSGGDTGSDARAAPGEQHRVGR